MIDFVHYPYFFTPIFTTISKFLSLLFPYFFVDGHLKACSYTRLGLYHFLLQIVKLDGGEYNSRAGEFNDLRVVTKEQWDMLEQMIRSTKGS